MNSFGISGTNAHIVLEEYVSADTAPGKEYQSAGCAQTPALSLPADLAHLPLAEQELAPRKTRFLPLSGKSERALRELAGRYLSWLGDRTGEMSADGAATESLLADMAWTAGAGRSHFEYRAGIVFHDTVSLQERLSELAEAGEVAKSRSVNKVAFVYTGQGSQWVGMGQALYENEPVARAVLDRCEAVFRDERGTSLLDVMFGRSGAQGKLDDTAWEQPALFALECALTALWSSVGIRPGAVMGHSVGELAAAHAAGVFSLEDGMRFALARGALLSATERGAMAAVFAPAGKVASGIKEADRTAHGARINISADNGTHQVISGPVAGIENIIKHFEAQGVRVRKLNTAKAFHSALVEPALDALEVALGSVEISPPSLSLVSNLSGRVVEADEALDGMYWRRHAREPVAFASGINALAGLGVDLVLEIGPHSILTPMALSAWPEAAQTPAPTILSSLQRPSENGAAPAGGSFTDAVAAAYEAGLPIRFAGLFTGEARRRISIPGYPFQRRRHWVEAVKQRRGSADHPLLGERHESARGEITFETELFPSDPEWLNDHRVFNRVVAPGALYGAMAASAMLCEGHWPVVVEDMQLHNPLVFPEESAGEGEDKDSRKLQAVLDASGQARSRPVQIFSKGNEEGWMVHVEGRVSADAPVPETTGRIDPESLKSGLAPVDVAGYYRARAGTGVELGPSFRTLGKAWSRQGEALGEVSFPAALGRNGADIHPLLLDGCFQVVGIARGLTGSQSTTTYLPFGWERLWLTQKLPERMLCHVRMNQVSREQEEDTGEPPEVLSGELRIYDINGVPIGGINGYTVKRATQAALLSAVEGVKDLLYEIVWRERALPPGMKAADFFPGPATIAAEAQLFTDYLTQAGVPPDSRDALLQDLERWSHRRALATLEELGWQRVAGETVDPEALRQRLNVIEEHRRLFRRMFEMLARSGVVSEADAGFSVLLGPGDPLPDQMPADPDKFADEMAGLYAHGQTEIGLFRRSGKALADVLRGKADPLTLLFSSGEPTAADLYLKAPVARAANRLLGDAVRSLVAGLPEGRRLRVLEIGAGTGSATNTVLPELPDGGFDYTYTDISAGFFAEAEARFGDSGGCIDYRPLDIEKDPIAQGFDSHGYDLLIASNVLHATRYLEETLGHCLDLLAPSGQLVALENLSGLGWMDLTFGQLDGWWRFADDYRPHHALAHPAVWRRALGDAGFTDAVVLGVDESDTTRIPDKGVLVAQGPAQVKETPGAWVLAGDQSEAAQQLAADLAARNQTVVLARSEAPENGRPATAGPGIFPAAVDPERRASWQALLENLPADVPFNGVVHLLGLDGHGPRAMTGEMAADVQRAVASALALVQGVADSDKTPAQGVWFITRGAQVLERETGGEPAGAALWGFGKAVAREAAHLQPRMIDLDPGAMAPAPDLVNELMYADAEDHIAYRRGRRWAARLVRTEDAGERLVFPEGPEWVLAPDPAGVFDRPCVQPLPARPLEPREVRVAVDAAGLNFWDVFRSLGFIEEGLLGREMSGYILDTGSEVTTVSTGDPVVGLGFGAFGPQMVTHEELVTPAPAGYSVSELATVPSAFVSAALSFEFTGIETGDRVLIHAGAGGVGLAAIQLVQAAGAEVFATASTPKHGYLRSLGVKHIFDSRTIVFGQDILEATGGEGVDVVLNSLTGEGFIDASLSCLRQGGRFVEMARRDILSEDEMAALRPDVPYHILELDVLKKTEPARVGKVLRGVIERLSSGELKPIIHSRWPLAEAGAALSFMRSARHLGKVVVTTPPLIKDRLRQDRTYLVTGGLGGIGCAVAGWLADHGAGTIVLNGRREPDAAAEEVIKALKDRGVRVQVELADMTDSGALDSMLARMEQELPPLGGVIHSVGVLSDGALTNQTWERFEEVLWPKIMGAWHLHRATADRDLDFFILFSSRVGVMGNPGQANHAAANAFLDQLAGHRRALGLPGQAIAWGAWSDIGEAAEQKDRIDRQRAALGGRWFTPQQGLRAFDRLVRQDATTAVVMSMDWSVFEEAVDDRPPLLEDLLSTASDDKAKDTAAPVDLLTSLREAPATTHEELLASFLQQEVQAVLRLQSPPEPKVGFFDLGMDSLMAVELRNRLNRAFCGEYTASNTAVFDYPDISTLAGHLAEELGAAAGTPGTQAPPEAQSEELPVAQPGPSPRSGDDGIAVIGMACRFPGASDLQSLWRLLEDGVDAVTDGRQGPGPWEGVAGDPAQSDSALRRGGFIEGIDRFDARFFGISPISARATDPQHRLLLETSWQALEDAGINPDDLRGSNTGVFAGVASSEYRDLMLAAGSSISYVGTANSMAVGGISFKLGLTGPAVPVELNCASSLVSVHHAMTSLRQGEVNLALAGGVNTVLSPGKTGEMAELGMLSRDQRCKTFDASADGFARGEGCGMLVLKRLAEAEADGDRVWAVLRGAAVNQNGPSAGPTAPNGPAQERVIEAALAQAGVAPAEVDYLEAHGAGSALGDPIEVQAAAAVYGNGRQEDSPLLIGSVKTNIGHLETAAGVAGIIKVVLAMQRGVIPRQLHFREPNPNLEWDRLPVRVVSSMVDWPHNPRRPPRAAISSFGISGTNSHVVVEGYTNPIAADDTPPGNESRLLPLSGKTGEALRDLARRYLSWLDERAGEAPSDSGVSRELLADMAWTAGVGRAHFAYRKGIVFNDVSSLREGLEALAQADATSLAPVGPSGAGRPAGDGPDAPDGDAPVVAAAQAYEAGATVAFADLFAGEKRRRISLPGYPFQRRRYWID